MAERVVVCVVLLFVGFFWQDGSYLVLVGGEVQGLSFVVFFFCKEQWRVSRLLKCLRLSCNNNTSLNRIFISCIAL